MARISGNEVVRVFETRTGPTRALEGPETTNASTRRAKRGGNAKARPAGESAGDRVRHADREDGEDDRTAHSLESGLAGPGAQIHVKAELRPHRFRPASRQCHRSIGLVGFYKVKLRPQKQWHDGRPTFDAFAADLQPYPHGPFFREGYKGTDALRRRASLDAREMFQLYQVLPIWTKAKLDTQALQPMERWARENPGLAGKYPADEILADLRRFIRRPG